VEERITTDLSGDVYKMSMSAKVTTHTSMSATKTTLRSLESRERDYTYDDAIEDYKTRVSQAAKLDLPKVDINKRRELFEQAQQQQDESANICTAATKLGTEIVSIKDRISSLRSNLVTNGTASNATTPPKKVDLAVSTTLKDRLSSLHQQVSSPIDETSKSQRMLDTPFKNVVETRNEFEKQQQQQMSVSHHHAEVSPLVLATAPMNDDNESLESDRDDSGIEHQQLLNYPPNVPDVIQHESLLSNDDASKDDEEESSVSSENDQIQSVMVVSLSENNNKTTNLDFSTLTSAAISNSSSSPQKSSNIAMFNFIHSNYRSFDDDGESIQDNDFLLECIAEDDRRMKSNELEKSNSVDTALSLCSSSDGTSLMDDYMP
jgi:23S rRNA pseudoU1915 N3-methylase RlmH